jgi:uncharacterized protein YecE (DUF72 family)
LPASRVLDRDAQRISRTRPRRKQRDVFCFFDNTDVKLRAPFDAQSLARKLHLRWCPRRLPR